MAISSGLATGHFWMMIGPLHNWAEANLLLLSLTLWSFFSFAISIMYIAKVTAWFRLPKWVRITNFAFHLIYAVTYTTQVVEVVIKVFTGDIIDTNVEVVTSYMMLLGAPAGIWGSFVTVMEALSGDLSSDAARKRHEE